MVVAWEFNSCENQSLLKSCNGGQGKIVTVLGPQLADLKGKHEKNLIIYVRGGGGAVPIPFFH